MFFGDIAGTEKFVTHGVAAGPQGFKLLVVSCDVFVERIRPWELLVTRSERTFEAFSDFPNGGQVHVADLSMNPEGLRAELFQPAVVAEHTRVCHQADIARASRVD